MKLIEPMPESKWMDALSEESVSYIHEANKIVIPPHLLNPPLFHRNYPMLVFFYWCLFDYSFFRLFTYLIIIHLFCFCNRSYAWFVSSCELGHIFSFFMLNNLIILHASFYILIIISQYTHIILCINYSDLIYS